MMTVALPLYKSAHIVWLALESLARQKNPPPWELIVMEETMEAYGPQIHEWKARLPNCQHITYIPVEEKMRLGDKWQMMANAAHPESEVFLLKPADTFDPPTRLRRTWATYQEHHWDGYTVPKQYFYAIGYGLVALFDWYESPWKERQTATQIAYRTEYMKTLPPCTLDRGIDGWLYSEVKKKGSIDMFLDDGADWTDGLATTNCNHISTDRFAFMRDSQAPYQRVDVDITQCVPPDIADRLERQYATA